MKESKVGPAKRVDRSGDATVAALAALTQRLGRCEDLDALLTASLDALEVLFGFDHSILLMLDETGTSLYTIATHGYERAGIGSEVQLGQGIIGMVATREHPMRIGNVTRMVTYARAVRRASSAAQDDKEIPMPGLASVGSQLAAPAMVAGHLRGVLAVESERMGAFSAQDEYVLVVVAHLVANAIELDHDSGAAPVVEPRLSQPPSHRTVASEEVRRDATVRFFPADGSTFIDGDYLIKGVAGRILWRLLADYEQDGRTEFTNREVRLDPSLELPAYRDNLESRLILLQRRLDERSAPIRIHKTGRGRFRLAVTAELQLLPRQQT